MLATMFQLRFRRSWKKILRSIFWPPFVSNPHLWATLASKSFLRNRLLINGEDKDSFQGMNRIQTVEWVQVKHFHLHEYHSRFEGFFCVSTSWSEPAISLAWRKTSLWRISPNSIEYVEIWFPNCYRPSGSEFWKNFAECGQMNIQRFLCIVNVINMWLHNLISYTQSISRLNVSNSAIPLRSQPPKACPRPHPRGKGLGSSPWRRSGPRTPTRAPPSTTPSLWSRSLGASGNPHRLLCISVSSCVRHHGGGLRTPSPPTMCGRLASNPILRGAWSGNRSYFWISCCGNMTLSTPSRELCSSKNATLNRNPINLPAPTGRLASPQAVAPSPPVCLNLVPSSKWPIGLFDLLWLLF